MVGVWGHVDVFVEKDEENRQWVVSTAKVPHQHLMTIAWKDAFRAYNPKHAPDYHAAIMTCQSNDETALTQEEEDAARHEAVMGAMPAPAEPVLPVSSAPMTDAEYVAKAIRAVNGGKDPTAQAPRENVLSMADFRQRQRK